MAIEFEVDENKKLKEEEKKLQEKENLLAKEESRKPEKIKNEILHKRKRNKLSTFLLVLSIIGLIYAISYSFSGFVIFIPIMILWLVWVCIAILATLVTVGAAWFIDGFKSFMHNFRVMNESLSESTVVAVNFIYDTFAYFAGGFGIAVLGFLIVNIVQFKKHKDNPKGYKAKLVWAIILTVLFVGFIAFDAYIFISAKK